MATPPPNDYISALYDFAGNYISEYIRGNVPTDAVILDVGAGWGKYRFLMPEYEMDMVDVWRPYVVANKLKAYYNNVYIEDLCDWTPPKKYDAMVMGDVLEHLTAEEAKKVLKKLTDYTDLLLIATPFEMEQEAVEGNHREEHKQADLSESVMKKRFPTLELIATSPPKPKEHTKAIYRYERKK